MTTHSTPEHNPLDPDKSPLLYKAWGLLGKEVTVTLEHHHDRDPILISGTLMSFEDSGQVIIRDDMGFNHYAWPMLDIDEAQ